MENSEIVAFSNWYKNTLDDFIDSSDSESLDLARLIDERFRNAPMSEGSLADLLEENCLDEDLLDRSSWLASKIWDLQVRQCRVIASRAEYEKSKRGREYCWGNKINPVVKWSNGIKISVYHYVID